MQIAHRCRGAERDAKRNECCDDNEETADTVHECFEPLGRRGGVEAAENRLVLRVFGVLFAPNRDSAKKSAEILKEKKYGDMHYHEKIFVST